MKQVAIVALPRALGSTITIPMEMLSAANDIARAGHQADKLVHIELLSEGPKRVVLSGGLTVQCTGNLDRLRQAELIFVPGIWGNPRAAVQRHGRLLDWLRKSYRDGSTLCSITTGSFMLAAAGLLDGRVATTHWRFFDQFQRQFPRVKLQRKRFITSTGRLYCTGSVNAVRDIMLHFIELLYGDEIARTIARHFTHELKRSYESLLLSKDQRSTHHDEEIIKVQEWLQEHYADQIQFADVANRFRMSVRSLNRRFRLATNTTPLNYLQDLRIAHAKDLLKRSNLVVSEIADRVGYQDASYFTGLFKRLNAVTPNQYRDLVRNKLFVADSGREPLQG